MSNETTGAAKRPFSVRDLVLIALFAALMAICSWISIPTTVPFTLQTFAVFVAAGLLGGKRGTIAVLVYILLGAVGLPVFAGFTGGVGILLGSTGGYIIGFLGSALVMWGMEKLWGSKAGSRSVLWCWDFWSATLWVRPGLWRSTPEPTELWS